MITIKVADMHCDTISALYNSINKETELEEVSSREINKTNNKSLSEGNILPSLKSNNLHIDLDKMRAGDYLVQNFALFINLKGDEDPLELCLKLVDLYYNEIERNNHIIASALNGNDILENQRQGKMSSVLTIEEGGVCKASLANLRNFYRLGVRMLTLTWNYENEIAYPGIKLNKSNLIKEEQVHTLNPREEPHKGLKEFGIQFVKEMEDIGMIIDVSHLSDDGVKDVLKYTKKPFVASHSNSRTICNHPRNLTDNLIKSMAIRGCVIGINLYPPFLEEGLSDNKEMGTIDSIISHIKYMINIGGTDCIGLGSDFDGIPGHGQLNDASYMQVLAESLEDGGISHNTIEKIFYKNVLNLYLEVL